MFTTVVRTNFIILRLKNHMSKIPLQQITNMLTTIIKNKTNKNNTCLQQ
jgi:hypothetical protein